MQLVALKHISTQRPIGTVFDEVGARARILVALGLAKPHDGVPTPASVQAPLPADPAPVAPDDPPRSFVRRGRSFSISHKPS